MYLKILFLLSLSLVVSCSGGAYYKASDAPAHIKRGQLDYRLGVTQVLGPVLSPVVRNLRLRPGNLLRTDNFRESLLSKLKPFDILLTRSSPSIVSSSIPSHFTHSLVWIGTDEQLATAGLINHPSFKEHVKHNGDGLYFLESSQQNVHHSTFKRAMHFADEVLIVRDSKLTRTQKIMIYNALKANLGKPYDVSFNIFDKSRLTCLELINDAYPNIDLPLRYTAGRYALIPDDLARTTLTNDSGMVWISHMIEKGGQRLELTQTQSIARLSKSSPKPSRRYF